MLEDLPMVVRVVEDLINLKRLAELLRDAYQGVACRLRRLRTVRQIFWQPSQPAWEDIDTLPRVVVELARGDRLWPRWWCATRSAVAVVKA